MKYVKIISTLNQRHQVHTEIEGSGRPRRPASPMWVCEGWHLFIYAWFRFDLRFILCSFIHYYIQSWHIWTDVTWLIIYSLLLCAKSLISRSSRVTRSHECYVSNCFSLIERLRNLRACAPSRSVQCDTRQKSKRPWDGPCRRLVYERSAGMIVLKKWTGGSHSKDFFGHHIWLRHLSLCNYCLPVLCV